jgi:hypothetical protein
LQLALWAILGATLGLAQLISQERKNPDIELDTPVRLRSVLVRLPEGWTQWNGWAPEAGQLQMVDPLQTRILTVFIDRPAAVSEGDPDAEIDVDSLPMTSQDMQPMEFAALHKMGWISKLPTTRWFPDSTGADNTVLAMVELSSGQKLYIQLNKRGVSQVDRVLVEAVANHIALAKPNDPARSKPAPKVFEYD